MGWLWICNILFKRKWLSGNMGLNKAFPFPTKFGPLQNSRSYPPRFGQKIAKLHHRFCTKRPIYFGVEMEEAELDLGIHLFSTLQWNDVDWWADARMESVFRYLRGSKDLRLGELRDFSQTKIRSGPVRHYDLVHA